MRLGRVGTGAGAPPACAAYWHWGVCSDRCRAAGGAVGRITLPPARPVHHSIPHPRHLPHPTLHPYPGGRAGAAAAVPRVCAARVPRPGRGLLGTRPREEVRAPGLLGGKRRGRSSAHAPVAALPAVVGRGASAPCRTGGMRQPGVLPSTPRPGPPPSRLPPSPKANV
jgi:hypothetical protein